MTCTNSNQSSISPPSHEMPPTPIAPSLHPGDEEAVSLFDRMQDFVSEHKKTILIATTAAVVAAAGLAYLQYASASSNREHEVRDGRKKKKTKGSKKKGNLSANDGPVLEEKGPAVSGPPSKRSIPTIYRPTFNYVQQRLTMTACLRKTYLHFRKLYVIQCLLVCH